MTGPIAIDVFLPAIPSLAKSINVGSGIVELSLTAIFAGNAIGQLIYGPLSDRFGRKPIILGALFIYTITAVGSGLIQNVETLIFLRFFQGLSMASGRILANAVARDLYDKEKLTKFITIIWFFGLLCSIGSAPMGGYLAEKYTWRTVFLFIAIYGALTFLIFLFLYKESCLTKSINALKLNNIVSNFNSIILNRKFYLNVICGGFGLGGIVAYLNSSSGTLIQNFGLTPYIYGLTFSLVIFCQATSALISEKLINYIKSTKLMGFASILMALSGILMFVMSLMNSTNPATIIIPILGFVVGFGFLWPQTVSACLQPFPEKAGTASTLHGFITNTIGTIVSASLALASIGSTLAMSSAIAICGICTLVFYVIILNMEKTT